MQNKPMYKTSYRVFESYPEDSDCLNCNTERDKTTLHDRTAGKNKEFTTQ